MLQRINELFAIPLVSVLVGSLVTWVAAWVYYRKAGGELKAEAVKLRKATDLVLYCLSYPNAEVSPIYDAEGHVSGLAVNMSANLSGRGDLSAGLAAKQSSG